MGKFEITYWGMFAVITVIWVLVRAVVALSKKNFSWKEELKMLLVYICIVVIARIVNFPMRHIDGKIGTMKFNADEVFPMWINFVPIVHMFDVYDGWFINIIGNITMFIPVGIVWPICFKKLDSVGKAVLAGAGFSFSIEVFQLFFYERCSDIDDLIMNTTGVLIGAFITFGCRKLFRRKPISYDEL